MRHALLGSVAVAALLASTNLGSAAQPFDWSGFYGGFTLGGEQLGSTMKYYLSGVLNTTQTESYSGVSAAGDIGYDWRSGDYIYGIAGDAGFTNAGGSDSVGSLSATPYVTLRGRIGMLLNDTTLIYGTAGIAAANVDFKSNAYPDANSSGLQPGFVAGIGAQFALTDKLSLQVEVRDTAYAMQTTPSGDNYTTQTNSAIGLVGLQFHM